MPKIPKCIQQYVTVTSVLEGCSVRPKSNDVEKVKSTMAVEKRFLLGCQLKEPDDLNEVEG